MTPATEFILHAHAVRVADAINRLRLSRPTVERLMVALREEFDEQAWEVEAGRIVVRYRRRRGQARIGGVTLRNVVASRQA